jgi:hypothetical protein
MRREKGATHHNNKIYHMHQVLHDWWHRMKRAGNTRWFAWSSFFILPWRYITKTFKTLHVLSTTHPIISSRSFYILHKGLSRPTLDERIPGSNFLRNQPGPIWSKLNPWVGLYLGPHLVSFLVLQIRSSPFSTVFLVWTNCVSLPNRCHVGLASICHFLILDPCLKTLGLIKTFRPIRLLEFIGPWTLDPRLKSPLA